MKPTILLPLFGPAALAFLAGCLPPEAETEIPDALQGRWGLTLADCQAGRPDAKGLMVVGPHGLDFYESRAVLGRLSARGEDRVQGSFAFAGEGQSWTRQESLSLNPDGTLTRRETAADMPPFSLTYQPCP